MVLIRTDSGLRHPLQTQLTADDGAASVYPDVVIGQSSAMVCWQDERDRNSEVYVGRLDLAELKLDERRLTFSTGQTSGVHAAAIPDGFAIALDDDSSDNREVYLAVVGPGDRKGFLRVSRARLGSFVPAVAWNGEVLGIAWTDFRAASGPSDFERSDIFFTSLPAPDQSTAADCPELQRLKRASAGRRPPGPVGSAVAAGAGRWARAAESPGSAVHRRR